MFTLNYFNSFLLYLEIFLSGLTLRLALRRQCFDCKPRCGTSLRPPWPGLGAAARVLVLLVALRRWISESRATSGAAAPAKAQWFPRFGAAARQICLGLALRRQLWAPASNFSFEILWTSRTHNFFVISPNWLVRKPTVHKLHNLRDYSRILSNWLRLLKIHLLVHF